jgi:dihydroxy-acid dehydratase
MESGARELKSRRFHGGDARRYTYCGLFKSMGFTERDLQNPIVGIVNTWSELNPGHYHLRTVAEAVKRGVWQSGGTPLEFNTISLCEVFIEGSSLPYRNLLAMDTEAMLKVHPLDAAVLLSTCDKDVPAQLMGAASADIPSIMVTGGPVLPGRFRDEDVVCCTDISRYEAELRAGNITKEDMVELESCIIPGIGACGMMGTANTMQSMAEALGMTLPGSANIPAVYARRYWVAEESGRQIMELMKNDVKPSDIMTQKAFENAIRVLEALGGSTNAIIHLIAIAHQLDIELDLRLFDKLSGETPYLANVKPSGKYVVADFHEAGGVLAVMKELEPLLHTDVLTVTGKTLKENLAHVKVNRTPVIAPLNKPLSEEGGLAILFGNLAPDGAVIKVSAASPNLLQHRGRAVVFNSMAEVREKLLGAEDLSPDDVLVLRYVGPKGAGMPEYGMLPLPTKLLAKGIRDMVRVTDARMSGGHFGTIVLHVAPEAAVGGPLAAVETGDMVELDVKRRRIDVKLTDNQIEERLKDWKPPPPRHKRGYMALFTDSVEQANKGCIFPFL